MHRACFVVALALLALVGSTLVNCGGGLYAEYLHSYTSYEEGTWERLICEIESTAYFIGEGKEKYYPNWKPSCQTDTHIPAQIELVPWAQWSKRQERTNEFLTYGDGQDFRPEYLLSCLKEYAMWKFGGCPGDPARMKLAEDLLGYLWY